jgi:hypothetical protein
MILLFDLARSTLVAIAGTSEIIGGMTANGLKSPRNRSQPREKRGSPAPKRSTNSSGWTDANHQMYAPIIKSARTAREYSLSPNHVAALLTDIESGS